MAAAATPKMIEIAKICEIALIMGVSGPCHCCVLTNYQSPSKCIKKVAPYNDKGNYGLKVFLTANGKYFTGCI